MKNVVFYNKETIQHLFYKCHVARFICKIAHIAFGLHPPRDMTSFFFQTWLHHITSNSSRSKHNILMYMVDKK